jgi:hypothetical protein
MMGSVLCLLAGEDTASNVFQLNAFSTSRNAQYANSLTFIVLSVHVISLYNATSAYLLTWQIN